MKKVNVVQPTSVKIEIEGIEFFLKDNESFVAINYDGSVFAYRYMPTYTQYSFWSPQDEDEPRYIGQVEFEIGDSFDKCYRV